MFKKELEELLQKHGIGNDIGQSNSVVAQYIVDCLAAYKIAKPTSLIRVNIHTFCSIENEISAARMVEYKMFFTRQIAEAFVEQYKANNPPYKGWDQQMYPYLELEEILVD